MPEHIALLEYASSPLPIRKLPSAFGRGINAVYAMIGRGEVMSSVEFDADRYSPEDARAWLKRHNFLALDFKPATGLASNRVAAAAEVLAATSNGLSFVDGGGSVSIKAEAEKDGKKIRAFSLVGYTGVPMKVEGFFRPVLVDIGGVQIHSKRIPILRQHDPERIVGHSEDIGTSERRITAEGIVSADNAHSAEVIKLADSGFPWQTSVRVDIKKAESVEAGNTVKANGRNFDGPLIYVRAGVLREISFVPLGADPATSARVGK